MTCNPVEKDKAVKGFEDRISRRKALKRVAVGAGVAWSAPILTSLRTPAFAQYGLCPGPCPACSLTGGDPCGRVCLCVGIPSECFCASAGGCSFVEPICRTDADCEPITGPGSRCAPCTFGPQCVETSCWAPCGAPFPTELAEGIVVIRPSR